MGKYFELIIVSYSYLFIHKTCTKFKIKESDNITNWSKII